MNTLLHIPFITFQIRTVPSSETDMATRPVGITFMSRIALLCPRIQLISLPDFSPQGGLRSQSRHVRSTEAVAMTPFESQDTLTIALECDERLKSCSPVKMCQILAVLSDDAEIRNGPNSKNANEVSGPTWPVSTMRQMPLMACQTHAVLSKLPVATYSLVGSKAVEMMRNL